MTATIGKPYSKYKDYAESYHVAGTRREDSQWRGKLATTLGYSGEVAQFGYDLASVGKDSYGRQLRKFQKNSRPAICDLTLNAPKSLSVEALVHSNPVAVAAHDQGVESALAFTEQHLLFSQVKYQGQVERVHTNKALIGSFRQRDNREGEPHLHTHNVIFNVGYVQDKWRSLANEQVYLGKLTIGAIYQNDTAYHLHQAGYKTYWDANGQFELAGNPKQLLTQTFAQRTEKLEAYLAAMGHDRTSATPEQLNAANRATRNQKTYDKDAEAQVLDWQSTAANVGIAPCPQVSRQELESQFQAASYPTSPQEIVIAAAERLSEKASAFGYMELVKEGCRLSAGRYLSSSISQAIDTSSELVAVTSTTPYPSYTTRTILQRERNLLDWAIQGKSDYAAICDAEITAIAAEKFTLNVDQAKALQHIATSQDLVILIQGSAGVGKTRSLCALKDLMDEKLLIGCAVGGLQVEGLEAESGIASQTIESLIRTSKADFPSNALIVVDEAGVVSNRQMHCLLERARESNCRLLLVGDTKQLSAVEQGNPFRLLQTRAGLETASISQNMRQIDEQLRAVVDYCEAQQPQAAFDLLDNGGLVQEFPDVDGLQAAIVDDYLTRPKEQRRNTLIMATTHKERATLTVAIRDKLLEQGELSGTPLEVEVLQKKDLDKHALLIADHYQVGELVRFWRNCGSFTKGELYRVTATNPEERSIELVDTKGQTTTLDLDRYKEREVFSPRRIEIAAGEEMRFTAGIKDHHGKQLQVNGQRFRVEKVDPQTQTIEISTKGKRFTVAPENLLHSDYRWISTVHSLQGATAQYAIFASLGGNGNLSKESWYVAASRAKLEFAVYCTDKAQLRESIQLSKAQRPALDLIYPCTITPNPELERQPIDEQALAAINNYVQEQAVESALTDSALLSLESLNHLRAAFNATQPVNDVAVAGYLEPIRQTIEQQTITAINDYVEAQAMDSASITENTSTIAQLLESLQLQELTGAMRTLTLAATMALSRQNLASQIELEQIKEQVFKEIASYLEEAAIEAALTQHLPQLTEQVEQLHAQLSRPTEQLDLKLEQFWAQAFKEIASNVQEFSMEAALIQHLPQLTEQVAKLSSAMNKFTENVANYLQEKPTQAAEPIVETILDSGLSTECNRNPTPSPEMLAAQLLILTDQILAPEAVYQEFGLRIERRQGQIRASVQGEPVDLQHPENLATLVNRLQALVNEFELRSLYEEFALAARREQAIANLAKEIVQLNGGNYYAQRLSVEITGSCCEIQFDQKVVFKSTPGNITRPDDLLQLSDLNLQLLSTTAELQQRQKAQLKQEQARLLAQELKAQSKSARTSTIKPKPKERDGGITL
jgi:conjugative relaxase-like TrwC/TraI family protein